MRFLDHLISWRKAMPQLPDDITRLRKAHYALEDLPDTIAIRPHPGEHTRQPVAVLEATVDDVAFAIIAAERESAAAHGRAAALKRLHTLAREAGGVGTDRAAAAVLKREGK